MPAIICSAGSVDRNVSEVYATVEIEIGSQAGPQADPKGAKSKDKFKRGYAHF